MWTIPKHFGDVVPCEPDPDLHPLCCQYNVDVTIQNYGGQSVQGAYVLYHEPLRLYQFIRHWVWRDQKGNLIDITPFEDCRLYNVFVECDMNVPNMFSRDPDQYKYFNDQEYEKMYYVYQYIDPNTNLPFYVGKGTQKRAEIHLKFPSNIKNRRFKNKIASLIEAGQSPTISFIAVNIIDERIAYELEEYYISKYGRKGYDDGGILLNICESARPPNHKGKTYQDIYGNDWERQIENRRNTQLKRGGFGPKRHSDKTKRLLSKLNTGTNNPRYGIVLTDETKNKISQANIGKRRSNATLYKLTYLDEESYLIRGSTDVISFCKERNISWSTLQNQLNKGWPRSKKGKTAGWLIEKEIEI